jgi:hypothetical protein
MKKGLNHTRIVDEQKIIRGCFPLQRGKNKRTNKYRTRRKQCARGGTGDRPCWYSQRPSWGSVIQRRLATWLVRYVGENGTEAKPPAETLRKNFPTAQSAFV